MCGVGIIASSMSIHSDTRECLLDAAYVQLLYLETGRIQGLHEILEFSGSLSFLGFHDILCSTRNLTYQ